MDVADFCPCLSVFEDKVKRCRLIALTKEISRQFSLDSVLCLTDKKSLLIKRSKLRKEKYKVYGSKIKRAPGNGMKLNPVFRKLNRNKRVVILGQDPT